MQQYLPLFINNVHLLISIDFFLVLQIKSPYFSSFDSFLDTEVQDLIRHKLSSKKAQFAQA